jgi:hypothetical protein
MSELEVLLCKIYDKIKDKIKNTYILHTIDVPFQVADKYTVHKCPIKTNYSFNYMLWLLYCYDYDVDKLNKLL